MGSSEEKTFKKYVLLQSGNREWCSFLTSVIYTIIQISKRNIKTERRDSFHSCLTSPNIMIPPSITATPNIIINIYLLLKHSIDWMFIPVSVLLTWLLSSSFFPMLKWQQTCVRKCFASCLRFHLSAWEF